MKMHVRNSRPVSHRINLLSTTDGVQRVAEARRTAIAHCLAQALAVRVLRRHQRDQLRVEAEPQRQA
jgi:hypothetical protein